MKVTDIKEVLNLALSCRKNGYVYNPLFTGDAGIGKSEICQAWAKEQGEDFGFIDLRFAYLEGPDLVGNPFVVDGNTFFATPSFWPKEGKGLLLLEEVNRAHNSTLNCLMQLLTDRRVNGYKLPDGWIIAGVINPDNEQYAVNNLDTALMDRFEEYPVLYDKRTFMDFINQSNWDKRLVAFIDTVFTYKRPSEIGAEGKYVAPRTLSKVNAALKSGLTESNPLFFDVISANLGKALTAELVAFFTQNKPILLDDILADEERTLTGRSTIDDEYGRVFIKLKGDDNFKYAGRCHRTEVSFKNIFMVYGDDNLPIKIVHGYNDVDEIRFVPNQEEIVDFEYYIVKYEVDVRS